MWEIERSVRLYGIKEDIDLGESLVQPCGIYTADTCDFLLVLFILLYIISTSTGLIVRCFVYLVK